MIRITLQFHCCGVRNYSDWKIDFPETVLPDSCCSGLPLGESCTPKNPKLNEAGCFSRFSQFVQTKTLTLAIIVMSVGILQVNYTAALLVVVSSQLSWVSQYLTRPRLISLFLFLFFFFYNEKMQLCVAVPLVR